MNCSYALESNKYVKTGEWRLFQGIFLIISLSSHTLCQGSKKSHRLRIRESLCQYIRINAFRNSHLPFFLLHMQLRSQILLTVESFLEELSILFPVLVDDMAVHIRDHINLGMA